MRKRFPTIVRVLVALALVAGLVAVTAAPASAAVTGVTVAASPTTGGYVSQYTVDFDIGTTLVVTTDWIEIWFNKWCTVPDIIDKDYITVEAVSLASAPSVMDTGNASYPKMVRMPTPIGVTAAATVTVVFLKGAGITNPVVPGAAYAGVQYDVAVQTSKEAGLVRPTTDVTVTTDIVLVNPAQAKVGTTVTVEGGGFSPGGTVNIFCDDNNNADYDTGEIVVSVAPVPVGLLGTFSGTFTTAADPWQTAGPPSVVNAEDSAGTCGAASVAFALLPSIVPNPTAGFISSTILVNGYNFDATAPGIAAVSYGGTALGVAASEVALVQGEYYVRNDIDVAPLGDCELVLMPLVAATGGQNMVAVLDSDTPANTGWAYFNMATPSLGLNPAQGIAGISVTATVANFPAYRTDGEVTSSGWTFSPLVTFQTNDEGTGTATFTIPAVVTAGASYDITATAGSVATTKFTVPSTATAVIALSPNEGAVAGTFGITGSGFTPLTWATVKFDALATTPLLLATINTLSDGSIVVSGLTVPLAAPGFKQVLVEDRFGRQDSATFEVTLGAALVAVEDGLNSIAGKYERVVSWDNANKEWLVYDPAIPELQILTQLVKKGSYWIKVTEDCTLTFGVEDYPLYEGWNSIGWQG